MDMQSRMAETVETEALHGLCNAFLIRGNDLAQILGVRTSRLDDCRYREMVQSDHGLPRHLVSGRRHGRVRSAVERVGLRSSQ